MSSEPPLRRGLLFVVSAPSGTGKTTVVEKLVQVTPDLALSRSYTSRALRPGEQCFGRLKLCHPRPGLRIVRHVRRIAEDQVEALIDSFGPVADLEMRPFVHP